MQRLRMTDTLKTANTLLERFENNRNFQFWVFQIIGWGGLSVVTFLSLTVWYDALDWAHISHTIAQGLMGMGLCIFLRLIFQRIWKMRITTQFLVVLFCCIIFSGIWTALRMQTFLWLSEEYDIWKDFGGWYFGSFMVFVSWSAFYYGVKFYQLLQDERERRNQAMLQMQDEQLKRLSAEAGIRDAKMKMLRYQLNPHFLFNTLNSISALVRTNRTDQARKMISQLSHFLRSSLDGEKEIYVTLEDELTVLHSYLDIEKVRYGERLKTEFNIDDSTKSSLLPCLILQPLLENALKYAVAGQVDGGVVRVSSAVEGGMLKLNIADSGGPDDINLQNLVKGVGLSNIEARLESHYGNQGSVSYSHSDLGGLEVHLKLPFETEKKTASKLGLEVQV